MAWKGKEAYSSLCYKHRTATGTHVPYGITQCYLPPSRGDIPAERSKQKIAITELKALSVTVVSLPALESSRKQLPDDFINTATRS